MLLLAFSAHSALRVGSVEAVRIPARATRSARAASRASRVRLVDDELPPLRVSPTERRVQWRLMQENFGCRWEGETGWFAPSREAGEDSVSASSPPLAAVYQLEFPRDQPEVRTVATGFGSAVLKPSPSPNPKPDPSQVGTWRGWGVIKPGDERTLTLTLALAPTLTPTLTLTLTPGGPHLGHLHHAEPGRHPLAVRGKCPSPRPTR